MKKVVNFVLISLLIAISLCYSTLAFLPSFVDDFSSPSQIFSNYTIVNGTNVTINYDNGFISINGNASNITNQDLASITTKNNISEQAFNITANVYLNNTSTTLPNDIAGMIIKVGNSTSSLECDILLDNTGIYTLQIANSLFPSTSIQIPQQAGEVNGTLWMNYDGTNVNCTYSKGSGSVSINSSGLGNNSGYGITLAGAVINMGVDNTTGIINATFDNLNYTTYTTTSINYTNPNVTLISPADNYSKDSSGSNNHFNFSCLGAGMVNITNVTLEIYFNNSLLYNFTNISNTGTSYLANFTDINTHSFGNFSWNCLAYDLNNNHSYALNNFTFSIIEVTIVYPPTPLELTKASLLDKLSTIPLWIGIIIVVFFAVMVLGFFYKGGSVVNVDLADAKQFILVIIGSAVILVIGMIVISSILS